VKYIKVPSPARLLCGAALAYWLSGIISPAFIAIAVMIVFFIPIFYNDYLSPDIPDANAKQPDSPEPQSTKTYVAKKEPTGQQLKIGGPPSAPNGKKPVLTK
jgi:hypothetical protein